MKEVGYDKNFLGEDFCIDIPRLDYELYQDVLRSDKLRDGYIADYLHYSLIMSKSKRQALLSICNLDQTKYRSVKGRRWFLDKRIGDENQLDNRYYKDNHYGKNLLDKGHVTRRTAITWGESDYIAKKASNDSCSYANACLQHRNFNEDEWRIPEKIAKKFDRDKNGRLTIITGPIFTQIDRWFEPKGYSDILPARIPSGFWKVIVYIDKRKSLDAGHDVLGCETYLVWQDANSLIDQSGQYKINPETLQISISELSDLTGIEFSEKLYDANPLWYHTENRDIKEPERYKIKSAERGDSVKEGWKGHIIHDRDDIEKHGFERISN